jgi:hypothetical protein
MTCGSSFVFWSCSSFGFTRPVRLIGVIDFLPNAFLAYFRTMPYSKQRGSKHGNNDANPIVAQPVRAMGLPAFLAAVFMPCRCFALCHPASAVWAGGCAKINA